MRLILLKREDVDEKVTLKSVIEEAKRVYPDYNLRTQVIEFRPILTHLMNNGVCQRIKDIAGKKSLLLEVLYAHFYEEDLKRN